MLGDLQERVDEPARDRVRLVQRRRDEAWGRLPEALEDQERWKGGWELKGGKLRLKAGGRLRKLATLFFNPELPTLDDYYEPWTYDYETLTTAGPSKHQPVARPESQVTGRPLALEWGPNWEDDLAGAPERARLDPNLRDGVEEHVRLEYEKAFMFYLPRICEHCLNPSCVASCPSGAMYKRAEDGIVLVDQEQCRSWRMCVSGCPYKKVYFNWSTGKAEKCTFATRGSRRASRRSAPRRASARS